MRRHKSRYTDTDPSFFICPSCGCRGLTLPDKGIRDLQGRRLFQCTSCARITSDELLARALRKRRLLD
jgi:hypothetical protein